ncbi:MAG: hypothetical protein A3K19_07955 [Lentisphaerae bacterium RIFOXYB12_FULL_65_16]|nr:MAG: hypothetical protein A3K18_08875 [Lentisphaerae bacterium RIFOXYA12_64_32]OGV87582.1 MAG: hypothetical protein A3K19_07955 [Lentisphaerae bacterium RIFOXYB12_FULL_65_16]
MHAYHDTGVVLKLYFQESFSEATNDYVARQGLAIPVCLFQETEIENAMQLKLFRKEITVAQHARAMQDLVDDVAIGRLVRRPVNWIEAFSEARKLSAAVTAKNGCRTLDVLHVAIGKLWGCSEFVTMDDRQIAAARAAGLKVVDVRRLRPAAGRG